MRASGDRIAVAVARVSRVFGQSRCGVTAPLRLALIIDQPQRKNQISQPFSALRPPQRFSSSSSTIVDNSAEQINDLVMFIGLIETKEAVENIDAILAVEGMDTYILGPADLSISLGVPFDFENSTF